LVKTLETALVVLPATLLEISLYSSCELCYSVLRRIELEVLATIDRCDPITELATKLNHSESYLSCAVGDLVKRGLVYLSILIDKAALRTCVDSCNVRALPWL